MRPSTILTVFAAAVCSVLIVVGDIAALDWFPHAGHDHSAPTVLGYVALYALATALNAAVWLGVWQLATSTAP